ncbi:MAG: hypothetical protein AAFR38_14680 [Planctomycetota bacterium]
MHGWRERRMRALPRWARVALAVRCARRVQPLFNIAIDKDRFVEDRGPYWKAAIGRALRIAEKLCEDPRAKLEHDLEDDAQPESVSVRSSAHAASQTANSAIARAAAFSAYNAIAAAQASTQEAMEYVMASIEAASSAIAIGSRMASSPAESVHDFSIAIEADETDLVEMEMIALAEGWDPLRDAFTPVPASRLGPVWPDTQPSWWPTFEDLVEKRRVEDRRLPPEPEAGPGPDARESA